MILSRSDGDPKRNKAPQPISFSVWYVLGMNALDTYWIKIASQQSHTTLVIGSANYVIVKTRFV